MQPRCCVKASRKQGAYRNGEVVGFVAPLDRLEVRDRRRPRFAGPMLSVHQRPFAPEDRSEARHREGDLIAGRDHASAIGTLVERRTRLIRLLHRPTVDAAGLHRAIANAALTPAPHHATGGRPPITRLTNPSGQDT